MALLSRSSSDISSTRASALRLIIAFVITPVWPRAAPNASPGKMYLQFMDNASKNTNENDGVAKS